MIRPSLLVLALLITTAACLHAADPLSFQELSLLVRTGEQPQAIVNEAARRKLLEPLTAEQEASLKASGASPALLNALRTPGLLATPEAAAAYRAHHQAPPPTIPTSAPATSQRVFPPDRFTADLEASKNARPRPVKLSEGFSLDQLAEAAATAQREHKPLGFIMVWGVMFDKPTDTRDTGSTAALLHFCEAFKNSLVLVFVRHETQLQRVPAAVATGFTGPDEGGFAPNMAVVDATGNEFIVEVPCGPAKATGADRDAIFKMAATKIQAWLAFHPTAVGAPPNVTPTQ
ncbi:MAG: hypothetical protein P4L99_02230 [Chthoniobacter sp.]|nr:hypothetical protein [Chthoniobacter sp.]